jgi:hypothetical protein
MKMMNYGGKAILQVLVILVVGLCAAFFLSMPGYAEAPNLGPLLVHVLAPISGDPVLPDTHPLPGISSTRINIVACRGEYEPASIVFRSDSLDVSNLTFGVSDLVGDGGNISKSHIDIRFVKVWYQGGGGWNTLRISHLGKTKVLVPELLLKDDGVVQVDARTRNNYLRLKSPSGTKLVSVSEPNSLRERVQVSIEDLPIHDAVDLQPITLRRNEAKQLWVTVYAPQDAVPGKYRGSISVMSDTGSLGDLQLELQVLPIHLQAPSIQYSIYYRGTLSEKPTISSEHKGYEQFVAELKNMQAHGVTNPAVYQRLDRQEVSRVLDIRKGVGLDTSALFYLGTGTGNPQTREELMELRRRAKVVKDIAKVHGIESVYLYGIDEAKGERLATQRKAWESVHQEGVKVFSAGYLDAFPLIGDLLDVLVMAGKLHREQAENFHRAGNKLYSYANPQTGPENPETFRRNYGLELWRNHYDGAMPYAYQDAMGFIWNDFDHALYRDHNFTYPTADGVIDTLAWEGFREGVDDVRYITTLERMLERLPKPLAPDAQAAKRFVDDLQARLPSNLGEVRATIIRHLLRLSSDGRAAAPTQPNSLEVQ